MAIPVLKKSPSVTSPYFLLLTTTMLGLEDYGSDSDASDSNAPVQPKPKPSKKPTQKRKVAIALPSFKQQPVDEEEREEESEPAPKKPRLAAGAGVSGLLSMLPAPKQKAVVLPKPERVLGGGSGPGLVFNRSNNEQSSSSLDAEPEPPSSFNFESSVSDDTSVSTLFRPSSVNTKGRSNISLEGPTPSSKPKPAPAVSTPAPAHEDFFSLGSSLVLFTDRSSLTLQPLQAPRPNQAPPSLPLPLPLPFLNRPSLRHLQYLHSKPPNQHLQIHTRVITSSLPARGLNTTLLTTIASPRSGKTTTTLRYVLWRKARATRRKTWKRLMRRKRWNLLR